MNKQLRIFIAGWACVLAGCTTLPAPTAVSTADLFDDSKFKPPAEVVESDSLFTLSPAMRQYIDQPSFRSQVRREGAAMGMLEALYKKSELKLDYEATRTRPAAATFMDRKGNCLSLVIMTAAFAKALNLDIVYQDVVMDEQWSRAGGLYVSNTHVNLSLANRGSSLASERSLGDRVVIDFIRLSDSAKQRMYPLSERTIEAMYLNNRAGEALTEGRVDDAYWWARAAVQKDPSFMTGYNTLGVAFQKQRLYAGAEKVYKRALERAPEDPIVMHNLVQVLAALGKADESAAMAKRLATIEPFPPFHFFEKGLHALNAGKAEEAKGWFARELRRAPYSHELHFWLAMTHLRLGDARSARTELAAAIDNSTGSDETRRYSAKLNYLRSLASGARPLTQ